MMNEGNDWSISDSKHADDTAFLVIVKLYGMQ